MYVFHTSLRTTSSPAKVIQHHLRCFLRVLLLRLLDRPQPRWHLVQAQPRHEHGADQAAGQRDLHQRLQRDVAAVARAVCRAQVDVGQLDAAPVGKGEGLRLHLA